MSIYGTRDGIFKAKKLEVEDKVAVQYVVEHAAHNATTSMLNCWNLVVATAERTATAWAAQPPYPMRIGVYAATAGSAADVDTLNVKGYDAMGNYIEEEIAVAATVGYATINYTNRCFARVTGIEPTLTDASAYTSNGVNIMWGTQSIGLPYPIASSADILSYTVGSIHATTLPTINATYDRIDDSTITPGSACSILYRTKFQE